MEHGGKYARIERERRFLLAEVPAVAVATRVVATRRIVDRYLPGTRLRLRRVRHLEAHRYEYKLTQKIPAGTPGPTQGLITNTYLDLAEYELLAGLPAAVLRKSRLSVPPIGVDVFEGPLGGLVMAEAEFSSARTARAFVPPPCCVAEVTHDIRFTGGRLVHASRDDLRHWLAEYGVGLPAA